MNFLPDNLTLKTSSSLRLKPVLTSLDALFLSQLAPQLDGPLLHLVKDSQAVRRLSRELQLFSDSSLTVTSLDDWETLPYDLFSPHQDIVSSRLKTLNRIPTLSQGIILIPATTLIQRLAPPEFLAKHSLMINKGDQLDMLAMRDRLVAAGYLSVNQVLEHGEFAQRGSILDLYPMGSDIPFRIDFFDDEIDSIRLFDPETQRSLKTVEEIQLLPAREFATTEDGIRQFRTSWRSRFDTQHKGSLYQRVSDGDFPAGIEYYLPLFHERLVTLFDYLPENTVICRDETLQNAMAEEWHEIESRFEQRRHDTSRPILPPDNLFIKVEQINQLIKSFSGIQLTSKGDQHNFQFNKAPQLNIDYKLSQPLQAFVKYQSASNHRVIICADSAGRRESIQQLFRKHHLPISPAESWPDALADTKLAIQVVIGALDEGFELPEHKLTVLGESNLFGQQQTRQQQHAEQTIDADAIIKNLAELKVGDAVVHSDHGIGCYLGLETITTDGIEAEYLMLEYADQDKLYVPVQMLHLISRYTGASSDRIPLHRLGSEQWSKAKERAAKRARDVAAELLDIYARRAAKPGLSYQLPESDYARFCAEFSFQTTPDQQQAIDAVVSDLKANRPMDRLVCGDVGFGKTEVALRAAFIVTQNLKQVAVLVPTTLLAQQHFESFNDRFADWPLRIEMLSRFKTAKEQKEILKDVAAGKVDILIGTHKLLSNELSFDRLGLVVIDEEHRFGVTQKEKIKRFRAEVDVLTLTATPIPRTLNMSFAGIRDLSIIASPPARRLAIKTFVREYETSLIREAIVREIHRGGQVYFLHNDVSSIEKCAAMLEELVPEAIIGIGHGQMREKKLEHLMQDFYHQRFNVLVCSTIIETGIDVPTANTIIIERADKFGLAQLHQLRGRVGRSHHQAYAFLLTPHKSQLTKDAVKRLEAIETYTDLGAGFVLATQDMEIRGAGELLGDEQSGQIQSVGFSLYMELLESAVNALKEGKEPSLQQSLSNQTEIDLGTSALIPEDYIADIGLRLSFYKRIANAATLRDLDNIQVELIDRFGLLPDSCKALFAISELKRLTTPYGMHKIQLDDNSGSIDFKADAPIEPMSLIELMQSGLYQARMSGPSRLLFTHDSPEAEQKLTVIETICDKLKLN